MRKWLFIVLLCVAFFAGCTKTEDINACAKSVLADKGISQTKISRLVDYKSTPYEYVYASPVTEEMIDEQIAYELEGYAEIISITDRDVVEKGDVVRFSMDIYKGSELVSHISDEAVAGAYFFNPIIEDALIGMKPGSPKSLNAKAEEIGYAQGTGDYLVELHVNQIGYFKTKELNDETIFTLFGYESVSAYREAWRTRLEEKSYRRYRETCEQDVLRKLCDQSEFKIDEQEVAQYALDFVTQYEQLAYLYGMELKQYYTEVMKLASEDDFYAYCYREALYDVEAILVSDALYRIGNGSVTDKEVRDYTEKQGVSYESVSADERLLSYIVFDIERTAILEKYLKIKDGTTGLLPNSDDVTNDDIHSEGVSELRKAAAELTVKNVENAYASLVGELDCLGNYGGCYMNEEGMLTIRYVEENSLIKTYVQLHKLCGRVEFEPTQYSVLDRLALQEKVVEFIRENANGDTGVNRDLARAIENTNIPLDYGRIEIGLLTPDRETVQRFRELISDEDAFVFLQGSQVTDL